MLGCRYWLWLVGLLLFMQGGEAGPWAREEGEVFLSLSAEHDRAGSTYSSLYGEYGLGPRKTLGVELGYTDQGETTALLWLQTTLDKPEWANRFAVSAGLGAVERDGVYTPLGQIKAGWGRGIEALPGGGWISAEASFRVTGTFETARVRQGWVTYETTYLTPEKSGKAEVTLGFRPRDSLMLINQLRLEQRDDTGFSGSLAISTVYDAPGPAQIEMGFVAPVMGQGEEAIKLGTWLAF